MTNQEILTKAIEKAIAGGWKRKWYKTYGVPKIAEYILIGDRYMTFIFNHDFAKALWGEGYKYSPGDHFTWERRLMGMVIADDPIKYLGENI